MSGGIDGFIERLARPATGRGLLDGLSFGLKDLYDVAGRVAGCGNPDWLRTHEAAADDCPVLAKLLGAGAALAGMTHTDELAYSLNGENHHYGTPVNPAAPDRIPGGSSSGSASVTAAGAVDFAIGSDTGGSVRVPAAYCGLAGIRTSHGAVSLAGCMPLAPSYDTCGWFAREPAMLARVGDVLLPPGDVATTPRWLIDPALFDLCDPESRTVLETAISGAGLVPSPVDIGFEPEAWKEAFRILQAAEIRDVHGDWVKEARPAFGPGVKDRFEMAAESARTRSPRCGRSATGCGRSCPDCWGRTACCCCRPRRVRRRSGTGTRSCWTTSATASLR
ncbi:MAG: amidase family protein [Minwuia sp.]|uniref:amidase family protein n=1 Tax=Minwuia sp. TaxID=2493630 RepID=UPI003A89E07B